MNMLITLLLVLEVREVKPTYGKSWPWNPPMWLELTTRLLLVLDVCSMKPTYRKSWAGNLLMWSDLTLGPSFKVKRGEPNFKVVITRLLLVPEVWNVKPTYWKSWAWESSDGVRFDLRPPPSRSNEDSQT